MKELNKILKQYGSKNYTTVIKKRPELLTFLQEKYGTELKIPEMLWCYVNDTVPVKCHCGNNANFNTFNKGYRKVCSVECKGKNHSKKMTEFWEDNPDVKVSMQQAKEETNLQKYGHKNAARNKEVQAKTKVTNLERYGTETPLASKIVQAKIKKTIQKKYGVDFPFQSAEIIKKGHDTTIEKYGGLMTQARKASYEKYGGINPFASDEVKGKIREKYHNENKCHHVKQKHLTETQKDILFNKASFINEIKDKTLTQNGINIGVDATTIARYCKKYDCREIIAPPNQSQWEEKVKELLDEYNVKYIRNARKIIPSMEIDFYLPNHNVGIEVGSIFWHSELNASRTMNYHYTKYKSCKDVNIKLFQWFDDELSNHWDIIKNKILYETNNIKNKIYARKCIISESNSYKQEHEMLKLNHIQGPSKDRTGTYFAYYNDEVVGLLSYSKRKQYLEITRFCTIQGYVISGLFSKMLKHMIIVLNYSGDIVSFSNNNHTYGNVYAVNGFKNVKELKPAYWYTSDYHSKINRQHFMKSKIRDKFDLDQDYVNDHTEWQLMQEMGYDRIWDAGKIKWELIVNG